MRAKITWLTLTDAITLEFVFSLSSSKCNEEERRKGEFNEETADRYNIHVACSNSYPKHVFPTQEGMDAEALSEQGAAIAV